ncbi:hypothetical protein AWR38_07610 [Idiomarina sp. WRN-38]|uniref:CPBP family glutamic-type intramembrane protease n=1 Tax=Idiomarina sp. OXR-189 TaxID=3100175 RepID=UPI0007337BFF|nr:CPBP family glutamic-type intramembrane protease [Idiomarina sp. OXR-189]KTG23876.1 hypothetical protein AUR68_07595 [Idiomarina sp. H105]OAE91267.1 hypothetical protein AWR38_07610 [Idiomarina sp. WRN-38]WPZ02408.1 CPBP family glutamic-type intramembrane protease [Idiomarina sp. OXR-189]|tara:strand:+ start:1887 stop:2357 length:471 start_codon:yes stop_codon:yes gene_type:complete
MLKKILPDNSNSDFLLVIKTVSLLLIVAFLLGAGLGLLGQRFPESQVKELGILVFFLGAVVIGPLLETLLLAALTELGVKIKVSRVVITAVVAIFFGFLHLTDYVASFILAVGGFAVYTYVYLKVREDTVFRAIKVGYLAHALRNLIALFSAILLT